MPEYNYKDLEDRLIASCRSFEKTKNWDEFQLSASEFKALLIHYRDTGTMPPDAKVATTIAVMLLRDTLLAELGGEDG